MIDPTTAAFNRLAKATEEFTAAVVGLRRRQSMAIVLLVAVVAGAAVASYAAYQIRSCTVEGGECYERNRAQTSVVIDQIIDLNTVIGECITAAAGDLIRYRACIKAKGLE